MEGNLIDKFSEGAARLASSDAAERLSSGMKALSRSVEGGSPAELFTDPETGSSDYRRGLMSVARSLPTHPEAGKYMDKLIDSRYGALIPVIGENPNVRQLLARAPWVQVGVDTLLDRLDKRKFDYARASALGEMSGRADELNRMYQEDVNSLAGYSIAGDTLSRRAQLNPSEDLDIPSFMEEAGKVKMARTGEELTEDERNAVRNAAVQARQRGFDVKGLHTVYARKKGGLTGQRHKAALDELYRNRTEMAERVQAGGSAVAAAGEKLREVAQMEGPESRVKGPKVNIGRFLDMYNRDKRSCAGDLARIARSLDDKLSAAKDNVLDALSSDSFSSRVPGRTRLVHKRNLDEEGGVPAYVNRILYSGEDENSKKSPSLKNVLSRLKKELYFKENILYTVDGSK